MRAIDLTRFGEPFAVLACRDVPDSDPGPGEVRVRLAARPINPSDLLTIRGAYAARTPLPLIPGFEGAGTVEAIGRAVDGLSPGDRVLPLDGTGTWAEIAIAPAARCIRVPDCIDDATAAQLYVNPLSAWLMMTEIAPPRPGALVVANAGASAVGRLLAGLSQVLGFRMVAIVRSGRFAERLRALGAAAVVDTSDQSLAASLAALSGGAGVDIALDTIGGVEGTALAACLRPGGTFINYGVLSGEPLALDGADIHRRGIRVHAFWLREWLKTAAPARRQSAFDAIIDLAAAGRLALPVAARFDLADIATAVRDAERRDRWGKVLLTG
ncbi:MAG: zinc-binding dehydrogenase [Alphaproteobacteria bacterium]|jgi:NADPH:quinone reductase-like Zn-dependent oxidoreductase|nr:zinc-binding dehydrogenase [Alphaproteobacteria bacterium]